MISSKYTIREQNEVAILAAIIENKRISRADLSVYTGLNKASVSSITKTLLEEDLILETGIGSSSQSGGRKPILLEFHEHCASGISIDISATGIEGFLSYINGDMIHSVSNQQILIQADTILPLLFDMIDEFITYAPKTKHGIVGLSLAIHGVVNDNQISFSPHYNLDQIGLHEELTKRYDFPVFLENEANLAALGEYTFSSSCENLISVSIHSGIGAGIVQKGQLYTGEHGTAGEIGHSILFPNGHLCPCGNLGCLELYASSQVLCDTFRKEKKLSLVTVESLAEYYRNHDETAIHLIQENSHLLSIGINNLMTLYDPQIILLNHPLYHEIPELINLISSQLNSQFSKGIHLQTSRLKDRASLFGGLAIVCQNFLNIKKLKLPLLKK